MSNVFNSVRIDENEPRFKRLKNTFTEEIRKRFNCEDYEPIVNYVFNFVFESKNTKENSIKEMRELFYDKTEEIMDLLWNLTDSIFQTNSSNNDLLDEIYKEKIDTQQQNKKFPSQIINPNASDKSQAQTTQISQTKPLFNSAIERVRDDKRGDRDFYRERVDHRYDYDRRGHRDYYDRRGEESYKSGNNNLRDDNQHNQRTMHIGNKKIVLKRRGGEKSHSSSPDYKRERSRDVEKTEDGSIKERSDPRDNSRDLKERQHIPYDKNFYPQERFYKERGFYNSRRFSVSRGRYAPRGYMKPMYLDPRRPLIRKRLIPRSNEEKQELETNIRNDGEESNTFTNMSNNIVNNVVNKETNSENLVNENRQPDDHQSQSIEEHITKDKKKVRCKKWPGCKNESCEYAHPKETCPFFPKCVFGEKCLFIHPNISCKYGFYCTRVGCAYSHPTGYNPSMGMMPQMGIPWGGHPKFKGYKSDNSKYRGMTQLNKPVLKNETIQLNENQEIMSIEKIDEI